MACVATLDAFRIPTESLSEDIYRLASWKSIFFNLVPRGTFPLGQGVVRSTFTVERSEPTTEYPTATAVTVQAGNEYSAVCNTTYSDIPVGFTEGTYGPEVIGWQGPPLCEDRMMFDFNVDAFMPLYVRQLAMNVESTISNRLASIYTQFVPKAVANTDFHFVDGTISINPPTVPDLTLDESNCFIDQTMLDQTAQDLIDAGATDIDTDGWISPDGPLFPLYIGMQASKQLMLENAELRADLRYADMGMGNGARTIQRLGAKKTLGNFVHIPNLRPPRFSYDGTKYVSVPSRISTGATQGSKSVVNPAWVSTVTAPYEGLWVLQPWVFTDEVVPPKSSMGGGVSFNPISHVGDLQFVTGGREISPEDCFDPLKKIGRHFGEWWHAPRPIYPMYGRFLIFARCPASFNCTTCS